MLILVGRESFMILHTQIFALGRTLTIQSLLHPFSALEPLEGEAVSVVAKLFTR